jgi:predicted porin
MKKTLIALAAVAVTGAAFAQATISGSINAVVDTGTGASNTVGFADNNLRFAVSEDLGGGLRASGFFTFEGLSGRDKDPNSKDAGLSLAGGFGTVTVASTRSSNLATGAGLFGSYLKTTSWDGSGSAVATRSAGTSVSYTSPELAPGLRVSAGMFMVDADATQKTRTTTLGATYAQGPLTAAVAFKSNNAKARAATAGLKANITEAHVTYNLGVARVGAGYGSATVDGGKALMVLGVAAPVTDAITVGFNYGKRDKAKYQELGATYALSKRTAVTLHTGQFRKQADTKSTTQSRLALRHTF